MITNHGVITGDVLLFTLLIGNYGLIFILILLDIANGNNLTVCFRDGQLPDTPKKKLSGESCITSVKFHPGNPAIIAAGTVTGMLR